MGGKDKNRFEIKITKTLITEGTDQCVPVDFLLRRSRCVDASVSFPMNWDSFDFGKPDPGSALVSGVESNLETS